MDPSQLQAALQKLKETGMLPMLMQKFKQSQGQGGGQPQPQQAPPPQQQQPQPQGGPQVKYDDSGAGAQMTSPVPQPHEAFHGIMSLLTGWHERKQQKQDAEGANIAQNLMDAVAKNDVARIHDIINDPKSTKILDKVYKGWLERSKESMMEPEKPEPGVKGFEHGVMAAIQKMRGGQGQKKPQQPQGKIDLPQPTMQARNVAAGQSAQNQAVRQDPNLALPSQLNSGEQRQAELGKAGLAPTPQSKAIMARAQAAIQTAAINLQKAQI